MKIEIETIKPEPTAEQRILIELAIQQALPKPAIAKLQQKSKWRFINRRWN